MEDLNILQSIISLGPSGILGIGVAKLWMELKEQVNYNREQDKVNLEQRQKLLSLLEKIFDKQSDGDNTTHELIKDMKKELTSQIKDLITHINANK